MYTCFNCLRGIVSATNLRITPDNPKYFYTIFQHFRPPFLIAKLLIFVQLLIIVQKKFREFSTRANATFEEGSGRAASVPFSTFSSRFVVIR